MRSLRRCLIAAIALTMAAAGCSSGHTTRHASGITADQLAAHLGVGAPKGWDPVDGGDARLWVPNTWTFGVAETCVDTGYDLVANAPAYSRIVGNGVPGIPHDHCKAKPQTPPDLQAVAFFPDMPPVAGSGAALDIHGYRIYRTHTATDSNPWTYYVVPQLEIQIATIGPLADRILHTLAPSNRDIATNSTFQSRPTRWHTVTTSGVTLSVPATWNVASSGGPDAVPTAAGPTDAGPTLTVVKPFDLSAVSGVIGPECCPTPRPSTPEVRGLVPRDGATLYLNATDDGTTEGYDRQQSGFATTAGKPLATLHHNDTTIRVWSEHWTPDTLDVFFSHDGSSTGRVIVLNLGRDGRVAAGVLASIRSDT